MVPDCAKYHIFSRKPFSMHHGAVILAKMSSKLLLLLSKEVNLDEENTFYHIFSFSATLHVFNISVAMKKLNAWWWIVDGCALTQNFLYTVLHTYILCT